VEEENRRTLKPEHLFLKMDNMMLLEAR